MNKILKTCLISKYYFSDTIVIIGLLVLLIFAIQSPLIAESNHHGSDTNHSAETEHAENQEHSADAHGFHEAAKKMSKELPLWSGLPFVGILLSIALFPLFAGHFWHKHFAKVSLLWALVFAIPFLFVYKSLALYEIIHIYLVDYIPFIILLWGLYTVSGGILLRGKLVGTPFVNLILIFIGTMLASWMGTTGAAMVMIKPVIRANAMRKNKTHIVIFFIFLVANIGGSLTPLGDPPLFLGFLHGVPFFWTFTHLMPHFAFTASILLVIFFLFDMYMYRRENIQLDMSQKTPIKLEGAHNFIFLAGILGFVLLSGIWKPGHLLVYGVHWKFQNIARDLGIIGMGILSLILTSKKIRTDNEFTWFPIKEVAYLFAGIFAAIIPMLAMLRAGSEGSLAFIIDKVNEPYHYFWITGILSSFLDNAPTYLTFFNLALGRLGLTEPQATQILLQGGEHVFIVDLIAISAGAVFFGAFTYIGNAPNFMVRSIAVTSGVKMPSFFGFMVWSAAILFPVFFLVTLVFLL